MDDNRRASLSTAIVIELADRTDREIDELPPLYDAIDPTALDRLVDGADGSVSITFEYAGHRIAVEGREFEIRPLD